MSLTVDDIMQLPSVREIKCCLLEAAKNCLIEAGMGVPELCYPSWCGSAPICLDKSYMTSFIEPPGITAATEEGCGFLREATFTVCLGVCTAVGIGQYDCDDDNLGSCEDPREGTYAGESLMMDDLLEALTGIAECFKCGAVGMCDTPLLVGSAGTCEHRSTVSLSFRIRW